jgi:hypothetical protein
MPNNLVLKQLIASAQVLGLQKDSSLPASDRQILRMADEEKRALSPAEIQHICQSSKVDAQLIEQLQGKANHLVQQAREFLLREQSHLVQPGGALFPSERAEACWRDCWQFFRVIVYAIACKRPLFTDAEGMGALRALYAHVGVPIEGLNIALKQLKVLSRQEISGAIEAPLLSDSFGHLLEELNKTAVKS